MSRMRILVYGVGGVGGYFGARLAAAGEEVVFLARGAHLAALRADGLRLESILGNLHLRPVQATDQLRDAGTVDAVILGVKAWQVEEAAASLEPALAADGVVVPLQNGVEAPDQLAAAVGPERVVGGACWIVAARAAPGLIRHPAVEPRLVIGELDGGVSPRVAALGDTFARAGVRCEVSDAIRRVLWTKFLFISAVSGVGAVTGLPAALYRDLPETRALLTAALEETRAVALAHGVPLAEGSVAETLRFIDGLAPNATASMQRDIAEGRPSELEAQNGAVVRLGRAKGVPTPVHEFLYAALVPRERRARASS
jgi:2-dehydropantoate 2-reductase